MRISHMPEGSKMHTSPEYTPREDAQVAGLVLVLARPVSLDLAQNASSSGH